MLNPGHVDVIVFCVCPYPFDPYDAFFEVDSDYEPVVVSLDVENDTVSRNDAGRGVLPFQIGRVGPPGPPGFGKPGVERGLKRALVAVPNPTFDVLPQGASSDNSHASNLACA